MTEKVIAGIVITFFGVFSLWLGVHQLRSGVAWTNFGGVFGPITRYGAPLFYRSAVASSFFLGGVFLLISASMLLEARG